MLITNILQAILSFLYLLFNSIFTSMLLAAKWSDFVHKRKTLHVSDPIRGQQSTYFLQLPYCYAVPLLILSSILYWSVSQSIFLTQIASYSKEGDLVNNAVISTCSYSLSAITLTIIIGTCLAFFIVLLSIRQYKHRIPLAGSCSAAISAAYYKCKYINSAVPLQWDITSPEGEEIGHCTFLDKDIRMPIEGRLYAGAIKID